MTDPAPVARFRSDLAKVFGREIAAGERIALAVSGGPDSMAMLALAAAAFPGQVIAATVDHRLRAESAGEAAMVAAWCAEAGILHETLAIDASPGASGNLHAWARQERYMLLRRWAIAHRATAICTAHHADDQAETFLMRAARGAGLSGLAAVRGRIDQQVLFPGGPGWNSDEGGLQMRFDARMLTVLRPLLGWRRDELRAVVTSCALPIVDDLSNADPRFERARMRAWLATAPWLDATKVARSAEALAETDRDLFALSRWLWEERVRRDSPDEESVDIADLPRELCRRIARIAIESVRLTNGIQSPEWSYATDIEPLLDALEAGRGATQAGVVASVHGSIWHFREAPPRRSPHRSI